MLELPKEGRCNALYNMPIHIDQHGNNRREWDKLITLFDRIRYYIIYNYWLIGFHER